MTVISFYNDVDGKTFYSDCAKRLTLNCERLGLNYRIEHRDYCRDWISNERAKPTFIKEMMETIRDDLLWIDVDCIINRIPRINGFGWGVRLRDDATPHDYVHYINDYTYNYLFVDWWIQEISRCGNGSHTAFVNLFKTMVGPFELEDDYKLIEADIPSKTEYLDSVFKK